MPRKKFIPFTEGTRPLPPTMSLSKRDARHLGPRTTVSSPSTPRDKEATPEKEKHIELPTELMDKKMGEISKPASMKGKGKPKSIKILNITKTSSTVASPSTPSPSPSASNSMPSSPLAISSASASTPNIPSPTAITPTLLTKPPASTKPSTKKVPIPVPLSPHIFIPPSDLTPNLQRKMKGEPVRKGRFRAMAPRISSTPSSTSSPMAGEGEKLSFAEMIHGRQTGPGFIGEGEDFPTLGEALSVPKVRKGKMEGGGRTVSTPVRPAEARGETGRMPPPKTMSSSELITLQQNRISSVPLPSSTPTKLTPSANPYHNLTSSSNTPNPIPGTTKSWISPAAHSKNRYTRLNTIGHHLGFFKSPYWIKTYNQYLTHQASWKEILAQDGKTKMAFRMSELEWIRKCKEEGKEDVEWKVLELKRGEEGMGIEWYFGEEGKTLVLGLETGVWDEEATMLGEGKRDDEGRSRSSWPEGVEMKCYGEKRVEMGKDRRFPYPRLDEYSLDRLRFLMGDALHGGAQAWEERLKEINEKKGDEIRWEERKVFRYRGELDRLDVLSRMRKEEKEREMDVEVLTLRELAIRDSEIIFGGSGRKGLVGLEGAGDENGGFGWNGGSAQSQQYDTGRYGMVEYQQQGQFENGYKYQTGFEGTQNSPEYTEYHSPEGSRLFSPTGQTIQTQYRLPLNPVSPEIQTSPTARERNNTLTSNHSNRSIDIDTPIRTKKQERQLRNVKNRQINKEARVAAAAVYQEDVAYGADGLGDGMEVGKNGWLFDEEHLKERGWGWLIKELDCDG